MAVQCTVILTNLHQMQSNSKTVQSTEWVTSGRPRTRVEPANGFRRPLTDELNVQTWMFKISGPPDYVDWAE